MCPRRRRQTQDSRRTGKKAPKDRDRDWRGVATVMGCQGQSAATQANRDMGAILSLGASRRKQTYQCLHFKLLAPNYETIYFCFLKPKKLIQNACSGLYIIEAQQWLVLNE
jgi:hypothetical protein